MLLTTVLKNKNNNKEIITAHSNFKIRLNFVLFENKKYEIKNGKEKITPIIIPKIILTKILSSTSPRLFEK